MAVTRCRWGGGRSENPKILPPTPPLRDCRVKFCRENPAPPFRQSSSEASTSTSSSKATPSPSPSSSSVWIQFPKGLYASKGEGGSAPKAGVQWCAKKPFSTSPGPSPHIRSHTPHMERATGRAPASEQTNSAPPVGATSRWAYRLRHRTKPPSLGPRDGRIHRCNTFALCKCNPGGFFILDFKIQPCRLQYEGTTSS